MTDRPSRTAILHIGPMKTGSTSIQAWLKVNRDRLREHGIALPLGDRGTNLSKLAAVYMNKPRAADLADEMTQALAVDLDSLAPDVHTCVLSGEMMAQTMRPHAVKRLHAALAPYFDRWIIVVYLRRQDEIKVSRLSTVLRRGSTPHVTRGALDFEQIINSWADVFGREALRPRLFARDCLVDGDVVADFVATAGLPDLPAAEAVAQQNASLRPEAQVFLRALSERLDGADGRRFIDLPGYTPMMRALNRDFAGAGMLPARAEAEAYLADVADSNERVRQEWFPQRASLFSEDFSRYSERPTPEPTADLQLQVALTALAELLRGGRAAVTEDVAEQSPRRGGRAARKVRRARRRRRRANAAED